MLGMQIRIVAVATHDQKCHSTVSKLEVLAKLTDALMLQSAMCSPFVGLMCKCFRYESGLNLPAPCP